MEILWEEEGFQFGFKRRTTTTLCFSFSTHDHTPYPSMYWVHPLSTFLWIVAVTTTDIGLVNLGIPFLSKHVFFITFNSIAQNIHKKTSHSICSPMECHATPSSWQGDLTHIENSVVFVFINLKLTFRTPKCNENITKQASASSTTSLIMWLGFPQVSQNVALNWVVMNLHQNVWSGVNGLIDFLACVYIYILYTLGEVGELLAYTASCWAEGEPQSFQLCHTEKTNKTKCTTPTDKQNKVCNTNKQTKQSMQH